MSFLRFIIVFVFVSLSMARAQCEPFGISKNDETAIIANPINFYTEYGEPFVLSVEPPTGDIKWRISGTPFHSEASYEPTFDNITTTLEYTVENAPGCQKTTIIINLTQRPSYTVDFNTNGGTPTPDAQSILKDSLATEPTETITRTGYTFDGWDFDFSTPITRDTTIDAKWKAKEYTITFNAAGGTVSPATKTVIYDAAVGELPTPQKAGSDFDGWFTAPNGGETKYGETTIYNTDGNLTLYAKWNTITYNITYSNVKGTNSNPTTYITDNTPITIADLTGIPEGYSFDGWEEGNSIALGSTGDKAFTAKWKLTEYTINYNYDGGSCASCPTKYTIESPNITLPEPTKPGYEFVSWTEGNSIALGSTGDKTFTATWSIINYNITYITNDGTIIPSGTYNITTTPITMPTLTEQCGKTYEWTDNGKVVGAAFTPNANNLGDKNFIAQWTNNPDTPTVGMLDYTIPAPSTYTGSPIAGISISQKDVACPMASITAQYGTSATPPTNAGEYTVYAVIAANDNFNAAKLELGKVTINKKSEALTITSATVANKLYDGTTNATVGDITFDKSIPESGTYTSTAIFSDRNVATEISVTIRVNWNEHQNYIFTTLDYITTADITKAYSTLKISPPPDYELGATFQKPTITDISSFINRNSIIWEYKREDAPDTEYGTSIPNRVGTWIVRATIPEPANGNYSGTYETATFLVTRGNGNVLHDVVIPDFTKDAKLGENYFVTNTCNTEEAKIEITMAELDMNLNINGESGCFYSSDSDCGETYDGFKYYKIPLKIDKPGVDTLAYELVSIDGLYKENDTLFIETPIPFENIIVQKWNNTLLVNNKDSIFRDFIWFKNDVQITKKQFYSAGPTINDTLNTNDIYKVTMHKQTGERVSTCAGNPTIKNTTTKKIKTTKKQVLGISSKNPTGKVYNMKGYLTKETPTGVYIVKE